MDAEGVKSCKVTAHWDAKASVWWAESDDVVGLVAEASSFDALVDDLRQIVPELLELNHPLDKNKVRLVV
jgi:hypothetical protein